MFMFQLSENPKRLKFLEPMKPIYACAGTALLLLGNVIAVNTGF
jgi:hypothetical protein